MIESPYLLFSTLDVMPQGDCLLWQPGLVWLHALADSALVAAYYAMPVALLFWLRGRAGFIPDGLVRLLSLLFVLCGTTYAFDLRSLWQPNHELAGVVKALAACTLWTALLSLRRLLPASRDDTSAVPSAPRVEQAPDTALDKKHQRIEKELRKLSLVIEHSPGMVLITGPQGHIEYCNPAFLKFTGYTEADLIGRRAPIWRSGGVELGTHRELWQALGRGDGWQGELPEHKKNGDIYWCLAHIAPIHDEQGAIAHYMIAAHDITALKDLEATTHRLTFFDPLTRLPNRALFRERLEQTLQNAQCDRTAFAVIHLNLDRFKNVNDSLGHDLGDQVLVAVSQRLRACVREEDTVARLGGDEFALILPGLDHPRLASVTATAIIHAMNQALEVEGHTLFVTASLGISLYPSDHHETDQLLKMADTAMYNAKGLGRNQYQYYKELPRTGTGRPLALETCLRYALERGELEVFYQPKYELASGHCHAAEALLRWRHPDQGLISPGQFIPLAEETGLIIPMGEWVLSEVCRQIMAWRALGLDMSVAVNLSAQQFRQKNLLDRIDTILAETSIDRSRLELEITESAVMGDPGQTASLMRGMKARGLALSIDDFGTGYSSLSYLQMFPIDILKIDQSFVRGIGTPAGDTRIVRAIIALAHSLELTVVAEGAETLEQVEFLKKHRCDLVQGYYYSRPVPANDLFQHLRPGRPIPDSIAARRV